MFSLDSRFKEAGINFLFGFISSVKAPLAFIA
jgi:hypothetical protein